MDTLVVSCGDMKVTIRRCTGMYYINDMKISRREIVVEIVSDMFMNVLQTTSTIDIAIGSLFIQMPYSNGNLQKILPKYVGLIEHTNIGPMTINTH